MKLSRGVVSALGQDLHFVISPPPHREWRHSIYSSPKALEKAWLYLGLGRGFYKGYLAEDD